MAERGAIPKVPKARQRALRAVRSLFSPLLPDDYLELIDPLLVDPRTARPDRADRAGDRRGGHRPDPPRLRVGRPPAGPVPADRRRRRRHPPLARLLADLRPRPRRRLHRDHPEAGRGRQGLALSGAPGPARRPRPPRRRRRHLRAPRPAAREAALHQRRQRHHPDRQHAAQPRPQRRGRRRRPHPLRPDRGVGDLRRAHATRFDAAERRLRPAPAPDRRAGPRRPGRPRRALPRLARAPHLRLRAGGDARRPDPALGAGGRSRAAGDGALPAADRRRGRRRRGRRRSASPRAGSRPPATAPRRSSPPAKRPAPTLPYGCRMGICHTCVGELRSGQIRDLRTGEVHGSEGEMVRTCVNAPEGPIEIAL